MERTLEHESRMLSQISHAHIVGFRAAQRLADGQLGLALESCEASLYSLIQERHFGVSRSVCNSPLFQPDEIMRVAVAISSAQEHLHEVHHLLHGDIKSSNVLLSGGFKSIKLCDLGVSLPLSDTLDTVLDPRVHVYEGTEPWRPPEAFLSPLCNENSNGMGNSSELMRVCDRSDIFAFGLVIWEVLTGEIPHAEQARTCIQAYRAVLGKRPTLAAVPEPFRFFDNLFRWCTAHVPSHRPSAAQVGQWLAQLD